MTSTTQERPIRADHIGSLIRPESLQAARRAFEEGHLDQAGLRAAEDEAISDVVALQESAGMPVVTDGEFRRNTYSDSFTASGISGVEIELTEESGWSASDSHGHRMARRIPKVVERIAWRGDGNAADFKFLRSLTKSTSKITLPGPGYIHYRTGRENISFDVYPDLDLFWSDLVEAYGQELDSLSAAGCNYVQLDETSLVKLGDPRVRQLLAERGDKWDDLLHLYIDVMNAVIERAPAGMTVGVHVCRSQDPFWQADTGYDPIAEALFRDLNTTRYLLEYDNPRAGTFAPLALLPEGKVAILGLLNSYNRELESADDLKRRIGEATQFIPLDQLGLSPQCGFQTSAAHENISAEVERQKLARIVEVANELWPS